MDSRDGVLSYTMGRTVTTSQNAPVARKSCPTAEDNELLSGRRAFLGIGALFLVLAAKDKRQHMKPNQTGAFVL